MENLTREAFWNVHFPGADEHLLVHNLRKTKEFIRELDFVAINDNKIVGNIMYAKAILSDKKSGKKNIIGKQFEYNQYTRNFFANNPKLSREDCIKCWDYKKKQIGNHKTI